MFRRDLNIYRVNVSRNKTPICCILCREFVSCKGFKNHLLSKHADRFGNRNACEWCLGSYSWPSRTTFKHVSHLRDCYKLYVSKYKFKKPSKQQHCESIESVQKFSFSVELMTEELRLLLLPDSCSILNDDHFADRDLFPLKPNIMGWWMNLPTDMNELSFWNEYDDLGIESIRKYARNEESVGFIQLMVRRSTFPNFMKYMKEYGCGAFLLPFSCLCSGGIEWHRHMICVTRDMQHFMDNCWSKVRAGPEKDKNYKSKASKVIKDWNHLRNVILYMCKEEAQCSFYKNTDYPGKHFFIMHSVTKYFKWLAVFSVEEGVTKLLNELYGQKSLRNYIDNCFRKSREKYALKIKHLDPPMNVVLPVAKQWACVQQQNEVTNAYLYLLNNKKLYFKRDESLESLSEDEWIDKQGSSGNCFMKTIAEEFWYPLKREQELLRTMREIQLQHDLDMANLISEINVLKSEMEILKSKMSSEQKLEKLELIISDLKSENATLKSNMKSLQMERDRLVNQLDKDIIEAYERRERFYMKEI